MCSSKITGRPSCLAPGWVTVGTEVDIKHLGASPVGATVRTTARVIAVERRVIRFEVACFEGARRIGEGFHARGLVDLAKFNQRLAAEAQDRPGGGLGAAGT